MRLLGVELGSKILNRGLALDQARLDAAVVNLGKKLPRLHKRAKVGGGSAVRGLLQDWTLAGFWRLLTFDGFAEFGRFVAAGLLRLAT